MRCNSNQFSDPMVPKFSVRFLGTNGDLQRRDSFLPRKDHTAIYHARPKWHSRCSADGMPVMSLVVQRAAQKESFIAGTVRMLLPCFFLGIVRMRLDLSELGLSFVVLILAAL